MNKNAWEEGDGQVSHPGGRGRGLKKAPSGFILREPATRFECRFGLVDLINVFVSVL